MVAKLWLKNWRFDTKLDPDLVSLPAVTDRLDSVQSLWFLYLAFHSHLKIICGGKKQKSIIVQVLMEYDTLIIWKNSHLPLKSWLSYYQNTDSDQSCEIWQHLTWGNSWKILALYFWFHQIKTTLNIFKPNPISHHLLLLRACVKCDVSQRDLWACVSQFHSFNTWNLIRKSSPPSPPLWFPARRASQIGWC